MSDQVNPDHYKRAISLVGVEVIDILEAFFPDDPLMFNAGKYLLRQGHKPGADANVDRQKAVWYINRAIARDTKERLKGTDA